MYGVWSPFHPISGPLLVPFPCGSSENEILLEDHCSCIIAGLHMHAHEHETIYVSKIRFAHAISREHSRGEGHESSIPAQEMLLTIRWADVDKVEPGLNGKRLTIGAQCVLVILREIREVFSFHQLHVAKQIATLLSQDHLPLAEHVVAGLVNGAHQARLSYRWQR